MRAVAKNYQDNNLEECDAGLHFPLYSERKMPDVCYMSTIMFWGDVNDFR